MKKVFPILAISLGASVFFGCSKDEDPADPDTKQATITVSVSDDFHKADGDHFTLSAGAANAAGTSIDWTVDGDTEKGVVITLGDDDVEGKSSVVVESVQDFSMGNVSISSFNIGGDAFTLTYKIEVNGNVVDEQTVELEAGSDAFTKTYQLK